MTPDIRKVGLRLRRRLDVCGNEGRTEGLDAAAPAADLLTPATLYYVMSIVAEQSRQARQAEQPRTDVPRTYDVRTYGCQMNVHDSERISGLLEAAGYVRAEPAASADVVVFNTCAVRENADNRLYGNLGHLRPVKDAHPGMQIAVGGCLAQKDRGEIIRKAPWVDVVFGTHNIGSLPVLLERARHNATAEVEILESLEVFPSTLPTRR